jgi:hypothetical protein
MKPDERLQAAERVMEHLRDDLISARKERDVARRIACLGFSKPGWLPEQTAHSMGWDYLFEAGAK